MMRVAILSAAVVLFGGSNAIAQEGGQVGLAMGYPTAIGVVWHATDGVGLKGEVNFSHSSSELDGSPFLITRETHTDSFGFAVAGQFYVSRNDDVSTYVSPRFAYSRITVKSEGSDFVSTLEPISVPGFDIRNELSSYSFAGSFGAQYSPNRRFSVFGELGLSFTSQETESSPLTVTESEGSTFGVRSAVGVILYFN